jgi:hypothetical protein
LEQRQVAAEHATMRVGLDAHALTGDADERLHRVARVVFRVAVLTFAPLRLAEGRLLPLRREEHEAVLRNVGDARYN